MGEQLEQISNRRIELGRELFTLSESLREEIHSNKQEVSQSEKSVKERTDEHLARSLSRMTRETFPREQRLREDMEQVRSQQD